MSLFNLEHLVSEDRLASANRIIRDKARSLTEDQLFKVADELRFGLEQSSLTMDARRMRFAMTDLQTVAFAAALVAVVESNGETKPASGGAIINGEVIPF